MSNRNNDVFQVLVTSGNLAVLPAGADISTLAVGQIGCFDANTNLSVTTAVREFYFAVGLNKTGAGGGATLEDIRTSAGQLIQSKGIFNYSYRAHSAGQPDKWVIGGYKAGFDKDYAVKIESRNSRIYRQQGFNQFSKTYAVRTGNSDNYANGDANTLTKQIVAEINLDTNDFVTAQAITRSAVTIATHGTSVDYAAGVAIIDADIDALIVFNEAQTDEADRVYTNIELTSVPLSIDTVVNPPLKFHKMLQTALVVSLVDGFSSSTITQTQVLAQEEGSGNNIREKEYQASGWNGTGPYVVLQNTGTAKSMDLYASATGKYDQFILEYDQTSQAGWQEYSNPLSTIIAIPEASTVTRASVATLLDLIAAGNKFEALADDAAAANTSASVVENTITDVTKDGLA